MDALRLAEIIEQHGKWLRDEEGGSRADLSGADLSRADLSRADLSGAVLSRADLSGADLSRADLSGAVLRDADLSGAVLRDADLSGAVLSRADLSGADLSRADLSGAVLRDADLSGADLSGAVLSRADLSGADLREIRDDVVTVLEAAPAEVPGLLTAIREGRIDGSVYSGQCACLVGTLANVRGCDYRSLGELRPDSSRPAERWFLALRPGDTPERSQVAAITAEWVESWLGQRQEQSAEQPK